MATDLAKLRVAIVHDWLTNMGGAERVVVAMRQAFPQADIFTSVYKDGSIAGLTGPVHTSFLQGWPFATRKHQLYPTLRPLAFESFDFSNYDLVISSSSAEAKGIITPTETLHIGYIHTPTRYYWSHYQEYLDNPGFGVLNPVIKLFLPRFIKGRKRWDFASAQRPDLLLANSCEVQERIERYYKRMSMILNPPVDIDRFIAKPVEQGDYYLVVSRLVPYKRVDLAIEACNKLGRRLVVVGGGPEAKHLHRIAGPTIEFAGGLSDREVDKLYLGCRGFVFTAEEDFGITPVEAMAAGKPVVAYGRAGSAETVVDQVSGIHFGVQTVSAVASAIEQLESIEWNQVKIRAVAKQYSQDIFIKKLKTIIGKAYAEKS